jgi:hypothetical protein
MPSVKPENLQLINAQPKISGLRVGSVISVDSERVLVDFPDNPYEPMPAKLAGSMDSVKLQHAVEQQCAVLLLFENNDPRRPIVMDTLANAASTAILQSVQEVPKAEAQVLTHESDVAKTDKHSDTEPAYVATKLAKIDRIEDGVIYVTMLGDQSGSKKARTTVPLRNLEDEVLVVCLSHEGIVILGQLYQDVPIDRFISEDAEILLKGKRVVIDAGSEIELICGRTRIQLDSRGKAVTKAEQIVSRARGANKIQGGCIQMN